jgi:hypothetical protein
MSTATATAPHPFRCHTLPDHPRSRQPSSKHLTYPGAPSTDHADATPTLRLNTTSGLISALAAEWPITIATTHARAQVRAWAGTEDALADHHHAGDILDAIDSGNNDEKDTILLALLRLAQAGDALAARTVLQAMLPKLRRLAGYVDLDHGTLGDRGAVVTEAFLTVLHTYPVARRTRAVAGNLALDTLHTITDYRRNDPVVTQPTTPHRMEDLLDNERVLDKRTAATLNTEQELWNVLTWALEKSIINRTDLDLLVAVFLPPEPGTQAAVAERMGLSPAAVRQRCSRATRAIRTAIHSRNTTYLPSALASPYLPTAKAGGFTGPLR